MDVSIVVPYHDSLPWLHEALVSVRQELQLFDGEVEVMLVDSFSTDGSSSAAQHFARGDGRVKLIEARRPGASAARNTGVKEASGKWIAFLDADDRFAPGKLRAQMAVAAACSDRTAVVYSPFSELLLRDGAWVAGRWRDPHPSDRFLAAELLSAENFMQVGSTVIRRDAWLSVGGMDETMTIVEDVNLYVRLALAGYQFTRCPSSVACMWFRRRESGSLSKSNQQQFLAGAERNSDLVYSHYAGRDLRPTSGAFAPLLDAYFYLAQAYADSDQIAFRRACRRLSSFGMRLAPSHASAPLKLACRILGYKAAFRSAAIWRSRRTAYFRGSGNPSVNDSKQ